ncbi:MAG: penicillin-binding protein 2 [Pseudomonadota bacterium]
MTDFAAPRNVRAGTGQRGEWRLMLLMASFCLCYTAVVLNMGLLAASDPTEPVLGGAGGDGRPIRGEITDRDGNLLAANLPAWSLYAHPPVMKNPIQVANALDRIFPDIDRETLLKKLTGKRRFAWIKRPVTPRERQLVHDLGFPGLHFGNREIRIYPAGRAMAHIVGSVRAAREDVRYTELTGSAGIEKHFDERLRDPDFAGQPIRLSLDLPVQQAMRAVLRDGMERLTAKGAAAVLMKVRTGEVVSMVSLPDFDPNAKPIFFRGKAEDSPRFNRAAQGRYELGSTFKVLTAAMAIEAGIVNAETMMQTPSQLKYGRHRIGESHRMPAQMTVEDIVVKSSNVGSAKLSMMLGTRRFKDYLDRLGMFDASGLELAESAKAKPLLPPYWTDLSSMTISFGHGLAASPIHLAAAYATLANDGKLVRPTLLAGPQPEGEPVFSKETSREMLRIMREVVTRGTARRGEVPGFEIGGKTGTAEKIGARGGYDRNRVISTFASVFPTSAPEYVLIVSLDEPTDRSGRKPVRTAGRTAVPVAAEIVRRVTPLLGMRPRLAPISDGPYTLSTGIE